MQRDFDLVVAILRTIAEADLPALAIDQIETAVVDENGNGVAVEWVAHHLDIMADAGLVKAVDGGAWRLTWQGYDALEQDDEDEDDDALPM
ncbi:hypothetical protein [Bordetella bronchiseptica]|uniref:hypothetical protein n=1 Tax=Bordetella bronchiseptica TaxID=518 RepID=UPI0004A014CB|nr:hypothetical protein [Bordetella bronchiseptica]KDB73769.1 hypothetical protein AZ21_2292 [Bordetella bronchiseptica B20-10725633]